MEASDIHQVEQNEPGGDLAQRIWRRYGQSPGVVSQGAIGRLLNHVSRLSQDRLPLLANIQRRWRLGATNTAHTWPELPYAHVPVVAGTFSTPAPQTHAETVAVPPVADVSVVQKKQHLSVPPTGTLPVAVAHPGTTVQHSFQQNVAPTQPGTEITVTLAASSGIDHHSGLPLASTPVQRHPGDSAAETVTGDAHTRTVTTQAVPAPPRTPAGATSEPVPVIPLASVLAGATVQRAGTAPLAGQGDTLGSMLVQRHLNTFLKSRTPGREQTGPVLSVATDGQPDSRTNARTEDWPGLFKQALSGSTARALPGDASQFTLVARTLLSHTPLLQTTMTTATIMPGTRLPPLLSPAHPVQRLAVVPSANLAPAPVPGTDTTRPERADRPMVMPANLALATGSVQPVAVAQLPATVLDATGSVPSDQSAAMPSHPMPAAQIHGPGVAIQRAVAVQTGDSAAPLSARAMPWFAESRTDQPALYRAPAMSETSRIDTRPMSGTYLSVAARADLPLARATAPAAVSGLAAHALLFRTHDTRDPHFTLPLAMPSHSPASTTLQARPAPGGTTQSTLPTMETSPATEAPAQPAEHNAAGLDIDTIADIVLRKLTRQLAVERERRGVQPWP